MAVSDLDIPAWPSVAIYVVGWAAAIQVVLLVIAWRRTAVAVVTPEAETPADTRKVDATIRGDKFGDS